MYEVALGAWNGNIPVGASQILLIFNFIFVNSNIKGFLDVPAQSVKKLPFDEIILQNGYIIFNMTSINAHFNGSFSENGQSISGLYEQNNYKIDLVLYKTSNTSDYNINRPQTPVRPFSYVEEEIIIENKKANVTLAGTLTYLKNLKPKALVLLAHGSGGHDRDETIYEHKSFMVIADHLTKNNIAVIRYDERGIGKSTGNFISASDIDFAEDILSGIDFAKYHSVTSSVKNIGIIGHSKGGATAVISRNISNKVDFIIFLGSLGLDGESVLYLQTKLILKADNHTDYYIEKVIQANTGVYQILKRVSDVDRITAEINSFYDNLISNADSDTDKLLFSEFKTTTLNQIPSISSAWFRNFLVFDPRPILEKTTIPILGLWGTNDLQVPAKENYDEMMKSLKKANNTNFDLKVLNGLNHLFQNSTTGNINEYEKIEETFSVEALNLMSDWIDKYYSNTSISKHLSISTMIITNLINFFLIICS